MSKTTTSTASKVEHTKDSVKSTSPFCNDPAPNGRAHCQKWPGHRTLHGGHAMTKWSLGPYFIWR
jgi:hypothetical protein